MVAAFVPRGRLHPPGIAPIGGPSVGWRDAEILIEEEDLANILAEAGLDPKAIGHIDRYKIMEAEANYLLLAHLIARYSHVYNTPDYLIELATYGDQKKEVIAKYV